MKQQIVLIHGGDPYDTYEEFLADLRKSKYTADDFKESVEKSWKDTLEQKLGGGYEIFKPEMPNWMNAKYIEWEIFFEKILNVIRPGTIFIGHSLGGVFLARYFSEHPIEKVIAGMILIAPPFRTAGGFAIPKDQAHLKRLGSMLRIYFSEDDEIVSFSNEAKYRKALPEAQITIFKDRGHFYAQKEFPEIIRDIKAFS